jgi:hypothetical protein
MKKKIYGLTLATILFVNLNSQDNWNNQNPGNNPGTMLEQDMAYIGDDKVLLFGGLVASGISDQTWLYDKSDNTWILLTPATQPSARFAHSMCYIGDDKVLLFGGYDWSQSFEDTWVFDLSDNNWTPKNPVTSPSPRYHFGMAAIGTDQVVVFSGDGAGADTWVYDLSDNNWTLKSPLTSPSAQSSMAMTNVGPAEALLLGHNGTNTTSDDTWIYNIVTNNWTMIPVVTAPPARFEHSLATLQGNKAFLFGGGDFIAGGALGDTWIFDRATNAWTLLSPSTTPPVTSNQATTHIGNNDILMYGGLCTCPDGFFTLQTWLYTAESTTTCTMTASAGSEEDLYFGYTPDQCVTKTATVTNGTSAFTYSWTLSRALLPGETMTGANTASVTVCLMDTAELCLTVTDANACTANDCLMIFAEDVRCSAGNSQNQKVKVCHNGNTICVDNSAVNAHLAHGDEVGHCPTTLSNSADLSIETSSQPGFIISPNPGHGDFMISVNPVDDGSNKRIVRVINLNGQIVKEVTLDKQNNLPLKIGKTGIYFVQLITSKQVVTRKLIVVR